MRSVLMFIAFFVIAQKTFGQTEKIESKKPYHPSADTITNPQRKYLKNKHEEYKMGVGHHIAKPPKRDSSKTKV